MAPAMREHPLAAANQVSFTGSTVATKSTARTNASKLQATNHSLGDSSNIDNCKALHRCHPFFTIEKSRVYNCTDGVYLYLDLVFGCKPADGVSIISESQNFKVNRTFYLSVSEKTTDMKIFSPIKNEVVGLALDKCLDFKVTSRLGSLNFANLRSYTVSNCDQLQVRKVDFSGNLKLRRITFVTVTFASIEKDTFTDLPALKHLALEYHPKKKGFSDEIHMASAVNLHCSCDYTWLRKWMKSHPQIISPKTSQESYEMDVPLFEARNKDPIELFECFLPMDCASRSINEIENRKQKSPADFSVNDPCL